MAWINLFLLAEMHRETYIAILKSWVPHGERGKFADRVGITQGYLSYLCALDRPAEDRYPTRRLPSPQMARKIAQALPAPLEIRHSLIENMELAHVSAVRAYYVTQELIAQQRVDELLAELANGHRQATFGTDLTEVRRAYAAVRDAATTLLPRLSPDSFPASLAQTCLYLHDAQCILDRPDDALRYAKLARLVLENVDFFEPQFTKEEVDNMEINAVRGEGVASHNLGLDREAQDYYQYAQTTSAYGNSGDFWKPLVGRDILNAMARTPRFSIRSASKIAHEIENICERKGDEFTLLLARESWLRCLIQREKWRRAQRIFSEEIDRLPRLSHMGSLHRALLLKSGALLAWKMNDKEAWRERITGVLKLMHQAGLKHQMRIVKNYYGSALRPIMDSLGLGDGSGNPEIEDRD